VQLVDARTIAATKPGQIGREEPPRQEASDRLSLAAMKPGQIGREETATAMTARRARAMPQ